MHPIAKQKMMTNKISIPKPCHENWNNMLPEDQGRHCLSCSKTVIDFSDWNEDQILHYLKSKNTERVCGRFNVTQVEIPEEKENVLPIILKSNISVIKKIAAIVLLCFGVLTADESAAQKVTGKVRYPTTQTWMGQLLGEPAITTTDTTKTNQTPSVDTTNYVPQIMGMIKPYQPPKGKPVKKIKSTKKNTHS